MATGYFKLYRPLQDHWIYKDSRYIHLWLECLINARWSAEPKTDVYKGVMYKLCRGQFLFSRNTYSERLGIDEATVRRCIDLMVKDNMLEKVMSIGKNKPTIYQVVNFDKYNAPTEPSEDVENGGVEVDANQVETQSKPSGDPVATAKEESNKSNKEKYTLYADEIRKTLPSEMTKVSKSKSKLIEAIKEHGKDKIIQCIISYENQVQEKRKKGFKDLQFMNESTFWNGRYADYLDDCESKITYTEFKPVKLVELPYEKGLKSYDKKQG